MSVWSQAYRVARHEPRSFGWAAIGFLFFFTMPALSGWSMGRGYEALDNNSSEPIKWAAVFIGSEIVRMVGLQFGAVQFAKSWVHMQSFLRANMLEAQLASGGPTAGQPVGSAGEAITHFRDDVEDVTEFIEGLFDMTGGVVFMVIAGFVLGSADPKAAAVLVIPLAGVVLMTRSLSNRIKIYRARDRAAAATVSGLVGDIMAGATTIKVNDASDALLSRLERAARTRSHTATRDSVLEEGIMSFSEGSGFIGLGLVLLVSAPAIAGGQFGAGQLAVFAAYMGWLSFVPRIVGRVLAQRRQVEIAFTRMGLLVADTDSDNVVAQRYLPLESHQERDVETPSRPARVKLLELEVNHLSADYGDGTGIHDVSFSIKQGGFTVITGPVGAGKSTLLRALLGLAWQAEVSGEVLWNGTAIVDRAAFFIPPNAAFLSQVPQLISASLADNVALGPADENAVLQALRWAALDGDLDDLADGSRTLIGPRGLRLSGGQRQRLAAARALVHQPELVVLDDLSSALDVETEVALWTNLAATSMTVLAVSHRPVAFDRADQIITLRDGRISRITNSAS